jgi:hypothetical protein
MGLLLVNGVHRGGFIAVRFFAFTGVTGAGPGV